MAGELVGFPHLQYYDFEEMSFASNGVKRSHYNSILVYSLCIDNVKS